MQMTRMRFQPKLISTVQPRESSLLLPVDEESKVPTESLSKQNNVEKTRCYLLNLHQMEMEDHQNRDSEIYRSATNIQTKIFVRSYKDNEQTDKG